MPPPHRFYHTLDLPGHGVVHGDWDLRDNIGAYLGGVHFAGKRVLDIGAASGFLTFHMEREGAEVISYDLSPDFDIDVAPSRFGAARHAHEHRDHIRAVNDAYWFAHAAIGSRARMVHGTAYQIPASVGQVDIAVFGSILLHLRDPFLALQSGARLAADRVIVVEALWQTHPRWLTALADRILGPHMIFVPDYRRTTPQSTWWYLSPRIVTEFLGSVGFERTTLSFHTQQFQGRPYRLFTVVGKRTRPAD